jgi:hypothetical protein
MWFLASISVCIGGFVGAIVCFTSFEWIDCIEMCYLLIFGAIMAVLESPLFNHFHFVPNTHARIGRYFHLLTRVAGKSVVLLFLGCALFSAMWTNLESKILLFAAVVLSTFTVTVGMVSLAFTVVKSVHLNKVRKHFRMEGEAGHNALATTYDKYALTQPQLGMTPGEFNKMVNDMKGLNFEKGDLLLIFNALASSPQKDATTLIDLQAWVQGYMVFL